MDAEAFLEIANYVITLKMYPYFDIAHCALCALSVREDLGSGAQVFSRKFPLSCWLSYMLVVFASTMLCNGLLGEPILDPLKNNDQILLASIIWYAVFYLPFDMGYKIVKFLPIKIILSSMKEIYRCKKIFDGVNHASKLYPNSYLIMVLIGTLKGNGAGFLRLFERLMRGVWSPTSSEFMQPSFYTKASLLAAIIFVLDKKTELITAPHAFLYFGIVVFFIYFKLSSILFAIHDPFLPFENLFCAVCLGGIWDSMARFFGHGQLKEDNGKDTKKNN